ncbi:MAG: choice-of-anchor D domain-containing protein, partial [Terracidiphilus sp.]
MSLTDCYRAQCSVVTRHANQSRRFWLASLALLALVSVCGASPAGAQAVSFNGFPAKVSTGSLFLNQPMSVAVNGAGDLFIADSINNRVVELTGVNTTNPVASVLSTGAYTLSGPSGVAVDGSNDLFIADTDNNRVIEVTQAGVANLVSTGSYTLTNPASVAVDLSGDLYIADLSNNRVVEVTAKGVASLLSTGSYTLKNPAGVAVDAAGDVYIADTGDNRVLEVTTAAAVSVLSTGSLTLSAPRGLAVDSANNVYISDTSNLNVVKVTQAGMASLLSTGSVALYSPAGVALDGAGNLYIADSGSSSIVELSQSVNFGAVAVGSVAASHPQTLTYSFLSQDKLTAINVLTQGASGKDYTADASTTCVTGQIYFAGNACTVVVDLSPAYPGPRIGAVQLVGASGVQITTDLRALGQGPLGVFQPGVATVPNVGTPGGLGLNGSGSVAVDGAGDLFIADATNNRVVEVTSAGVSSVLNTASLPGTATGQSVHACHATGLCHPSGVAVDGAGNVYVTDTDNGRVVEVAAGVASVLNTGSLTLSIPTGIAVDGAGNLVIADSNLNRVIEVTGVNSANPASNLIGTGSFALSGPQGVAIDAAGDIVIADTGNNRVLEVTAAGVASVLNNGTVNLAASAFTQSEAGAPLIALIPVGDTLSGYVQFATSNGSKTGTQTVNMAAYSNLGSSTPTTATAAAVALGQALTTGALGTASGSTYTGSIRNGVLSIATSTATEVLSVTASNAVATNPASSGSSADLTTLNSPAGVAVDGANNVYIADSGNKRVLQVTAAGAASVLNIGSLPLTDPTGVAVDGAGDVYVADSATSAVLELNQSQESLTFDSTSVGDTSADSPQNVTVQNVGNQTLEFTALAAVTTGQTASSFNLNGSATSCSSTESLPAGESCILGVEFVPTLAGSLAGSVNITDNSSNAVAPNNVQQITLSGVATTATATTLTAPANAALGASVTLTATVLAGTTPVT